MNNRYDRKRVAKHEKITNALEICEHEITLFCSLLQPDDKEIALYLANCDINKDIVVRKPNLGEDGLQVMCYPSTITELEYDIDWSLLPPSLNPASGDLDSNRARRKREQLCSLVAHIECQLQRLQHLPSSANSSNTRQIIDFGSGSGHLGILLAYRNPSYEVILVERKEYSVVQANARIANAGILNISIYCGDIRTIHDHYPHLNLILGISLHSCGLFTDYIIDMCIQLKAAYVLVPCCYGQIRKPPPDAVFSLQQHDATKNRVLRCLKDVDILSIISSAADHIVDMNIDYQDSDAFMIAKRAMRIIDFDRMIRCIHAYNGGENSIGSYECIMSSMLPVTCSPKNNIILGRPDVNHISTHIPVYNLGMMLATNTYLS